MPFQLHSRGLSYVWFHDGRQNILEQKNNERFAAHFGMAVPLTKLYDGLKAGNPKLRKEESFMELHFFEMLQYNIGDGRYMGLFECDDTKLYLQIPKLECQYNGH